MAKLDGNKAAVITGASSGSGEVTAEALAKEGASVLVAARREERLSDLFGRINGKKGRKALSVECDVTDEEQARDLISRANDELGWVDILVNNAGVMQLSKIEKGHSDEWRTMFDVNASFASAQYLLPHNYLGGRRGGNVDRQRACMILAESMMPHFVTGSAGVFGNVAVERSY